MSVILPAQILGAHFYGTPLTWINSIPSLDK